MPTVPIEIVNDSIHGFMPWSTANGFVHPGHLGRYRPGVHLEVGAGRLGLIQGAPFGVGGCGRREQPAYQTTADVNFDDDMKPTRTKRSGDRRLPYQRDQQLGLPFFLAKAGTLTFSFTAQQLQPRPAPRESLNG